MGGVGVGAGVGVGGGGGRVGGAVRGCGAAAASVRGPGGAGRTTTPTPTPTPNPAGQGAPGIAGVGHCALAAAEAREHEGALEERGELHGHLELAQLHGDHVEAALLLAAGRQGRAAGAPRDAARPRDGPCSATHHTPPCAPPCHARGM